MITGESPGRQGPCGPSLRLSVAGPAVGGAGHAYRQAGRRSVWLLAFLTLLGGVVLPAWAGDSVAVGSVVAETRSSSPRSFLSGVPPEAKRVAPILQRALELFQSGTATRRAIKQLRTDQDALKTKLTTINGEFEVLTQHRAQLQQQVVALEAEHQARLTSLRQELEAKLAGELSSAAQQMQAEFEQEFASEVQGFEQRQRGEIEKLLDQAIQLQERELQQLGQELELQAHELADRLARLEANPEIVNGVVRSASEAMAKRQAELQARRTGLQREREVRVARARSEFVGRLKAQQPAEQKRRLTIREASLRHAMAGLLHNTHLEEMSRIEQVRQTSEHARERSSFLAQEQASLSARIASLEEKLAAQARRAQTLGLEREAALTTLEQAFREPKTGTPQVTLAWFGQVIGQLPPELASELGLMQQRLVTAAVQERQLQEQQHVLRERQLAMQLAHEMEVKRQQAASKQRLEEEARAKKAEESLARAEQLADQGAFDEALQLVSRAQALNPPQIERVTMVREALLAEQDAARIRAKSAELERSFTQAMSVFQEGRYEEAITLFEQVIAQEAEMEGSKGVTFAGAEVPGGESP